MEQSPQDANGGECQGKFYAKYDVYKLVLCYIIAQSVRVAHTLLKTLLASPVQPTVTHMRLVYLNAHVSMDSTEPQETLSILVAQVSD